jgi:hypothetical protein
MAVFKLRRHEPIYTTTSRGREGPLRFSKDRRMPITAIAPTHAVAPRASARPAPTEAAAMPDMPKPVTPATAAGYLMQVPSARVLEALASLQRVMSQQAPTDAAKQLADAISPAAAGGEVNIEA